MRKLAVVTSIQPTASGLFLHVRPQCLPGCPTSQKIVPALLALLTRVKITIIIVISYGNARGRIVTREALMVLVDSDLSWWLYTERRVCSTLSVPLYGRLHGTQVPLDADGWTTVQQAGE